ncbi:hypothetical protein LAZ67_4002810 [Cordylochernes scorpioides]|uniref:Endonuclease/exonuclease/phosphatase domain-containing protein n=1 Tax=Cordylochernes scorpioides TaxID=51811 RepID=A0ABY6KGJ5_9ARAC|nr:hypothetical protein LAZ67_4002810 [Cordylochernes scorpioides]
MGAVATLVILETNQNLVKYSKGPGGTARRCGRTSPLPLGMPSLQDKALLVNFFNCDSESATEALRAFRSFKYIRSGKGPMSCYSLKRLIKSFEETGSLEAEPRSGRPSTCKSVAVTVLQNAEAIETLSPYGENQRQIMTFVLSFGSTFWLPLPIQMPFHYSRSQHGQGSNVECSYSPMVPVGDGWLRHTSRAFQIAVSSQVKFEEICPAPSLILMFVPSCSIMLIPAPPLLRVRSEDPSVYAVKGRGLAFFINNLYYEDIAVNIPNTLDLETQGIKVYLNQNKAINIYNMYHPPNNTFIDDGTMAQFLTDNTIILGDLNAKHQLWGCSKPNPRGKILSNIFDDNAFMCLNDGNPTHHSYSYNTAQALDISFYYPEIFHKCK